MTSAAGFTGHLPSTADHIFGGMIIDLPECTMRLCPSSNPNFDPDRIVRFKVHFSGGPGIFHSVASICQLRGFPETMLKAIFPGLCLRLSISIN